MPSKKQTRRKLDLTHLGSLNSDITSEPEKVEPEKVEPAKAEQAKLEVVKVEPQKPVEEPVAAEAVETPVPPVVAAEPEATEAPKENRQFDRRPQRYEPKPLQTLETASNASGEDFKLGDKIQLFAPWGKKAIAEVSLIYQDESQNVWVQYFPVEEIPANWSWLGGCTRAERVVCAS
ncbi:MAG: hypothetical protein WA828_21605 [Coleofasciculaceae cyanobacterium]